MTGKEGNLLQVLIPTPGCERGCKQDKTPVWLLSTPPFLPPEDAPTESKWAQLLSAHRVLQIQRTAVAMRMVWIWAQDPLSSDRATTSRFDQFGTQIFQKTLCKDASYLGHTYLGCEVSDFCQHETIKKQKPLRFIFCHIKSNFKCQVL